MSIKIINAGMLSTIQDGGRFGVMKYGFTQSGAMDSKAMATANILVGNEPECAVIETTLLGITAEFTDNTVIALSGGDFSAAINGTPIKRNKAYAVNAGDTLAMSYAKSGVRGYLAVSGGFDVPEVMGSRSTNLKSQIGGFFGRKLAAGDIINTFAPIITDTTGRELPEGTYENSITLRAVLGPQDYMFTEEDIKTFFSCEYKITQQADRMGIRLDGEPLKGKGSMDIVSDGIVFGSVQVPKNGMPIILAADRQTTGGYAKIATIISADRHLIAQARPGGTIKFAQVSVKEAQKIAKQEQKALKKLKF